MRHILLILVGMGLFFACGTKKELVRTGAFYDIAPRFVRTEGSKDYFLVYGKGINEQACLGNASVYLLKTLIYQGSREGTNIAPLLNEPKSIAAVKAQEQTVINGLLMRTGLLESSGSPTNRIRQSTDKNALYNMSFEIGVNRNLLATEIARFK